MPDGAGGFNLLEVGDELGGVQSPCTISITDYGPHIPASWPAGVFFIHTHPVPPGASAAESCGGFQLSGTISNGPSSEDFSTLRILSAASSNEVMGVVIDEDEVFIFRKDGSIQKESARCGY